MACWRERANTSEDVRAWFLCLSIPVKQPTTRSPKKLWFVKIPFPRTSFSFSRPVFWWRCVLPSSNDGTETLLAEGDELSALGPLKPGSYTTRKGSRVDLSLNVPSHQTSHIPLYFPECGCVHACTVPPACQFRFLGLACPQIGCYPVPYTVTWGSNSPASLSFLVRDLL